MKLVINLTNYKNKNDLLNFLKSNFNEMYSANYDAMIDTLTFESNLTIEFLNINDFNDKENLIEVLEIIKQENSKINIMY